AGAGFARGRCDEIAEQVDLVIRVDILQHGRNAFEAHAGIDTGLGQRREVAGRVAIELHEDQIPDLDIAVTVFVGRARRATPDVGTVIVENFGTGAAGAGIGHLPEVVGSVTRALVVANANDA